jgi:hypothetical protein
MGDKNKKMCAFPHVNGFGGNTGMTLRDYFAAKAMQGMLAADADYTETTVENAYKIADLMMEERDK